MGALNVNFKVSCEILSQVGHYSVYPCVTVPQSSFHEIADFEVYGCYGLSG